MNRPDPMPVSGNAFAHDTMTVRVPGILRGVRDTFPGTQIARELDALADSLIAGDPIPRLRLPAPDADAWEAAYDAQPYDPLTWHNSVWFFAETFIYRHVIEVVRWFETGRDPFAATKQSELDGDRLWRLLDTTQTVEGDLFTRFSILLGLNLWANRVDLSHGAAALAETSGADDLLADDRAALVESLGDGLSAGTYHLIADNAGTELAIDLALADFLLTASGGTLVLHLKMHPTFVSDAIPADVWHLIDAMDAHGDRLRALAQRLRRAWADRRLILAPHFFWNSSRFLWEMPPSLVRTFTGSPLVILKGDMNYRRATGDALWPVDTPFADVLRTFPAPLLALRAMKCDVLIGVPADVAARLDQQHADNWRATGQYGLIQFAE